MTIQRPDERDTAERAYALWEARGRPNGSPEHDWFDAHMQLCAELDDVRQPRATLDPLAQEAADQLVDDVMRSPGESEDRTANPVPKPPRARPRPSERPKGQRSIVPSRGQH